MATSIIDSSRIERTEFSNDEIARYSRHLIMPEVTLEGQKRLKASSILCIGRVASDRRSPSTWRRRAWAGSAWWTRTPLISPISSAKSCTAPRMSAAKS